MIELLVWNDFIDLIKLMGISAATSSASVVLPQIVITESDIHPATRGENEEGKNN
jgi:hypothetical protein